MKILGLGTALPAHSIRQEDAARLAEETLGLDKSQRETIRTLYRLSGVQRRGSVLLRSDEGSQSAQDLYEPRSTELPLGPGLSTRMNRYTMAAAELAVRAGRNALNDAGALPEQITHLVTVSCTGFEAPGVDIEIIEQLELPLTVERTHIGFMGCHGALNGLRVARALAEAGGTVLVVCVEICSIHFSYRDSPDQIVANSLFADGAAAAVIGEGPRAIAAINATGTRVIENSREAMAWRITDHGFEMELSPRVPRIIERDLASIVEPWLESHGFGVVEIGGWAVHPGGPRILDSVRRSLRFSREELHHSREILEQHGNMSSPTVLFILDRLRRSSTPRPWVMMAFGPGLTAEFSLLV